MENGDKLMDLTQALRLASLLIEWEIEQPQVQPPPMAWEQELRAARQTINKAIERNPGEFFHSAAVKTRGRKSHHIIR